ncbi:hypothetical protein MmiEs2_13630 [Methanimicrococcus stummii]|uniref:GLUG domain-containing protein n=1 Tax=Methanimicrococcus stummii TaxID=3028294 RepID=A0AA96VIT9_9EURY|nr:GLUG motif-containing protein [Methanimicrococcus sp. Es2]WNY29146.1 hypothetical protein MmiEs2_13630 [Methanimicrococcus sp. Es2]
MVLLLFFTSAACAAQIPISSIADLEKIGNHGSYPLDGDYILMNDITITDTWAPIGNTSSPFFGTFDGNNKSIIFESSGAYVGFDSPGRIQEDGYGLFGKVGRPDRNKKVEIKNVNLVLESNLKSGSNFGSLVGIVNGSSSYPFSMENCSLTSDGDFKIEGGNSFGGLVGRVDSAAVFKNCSISDSSGSVSVIGNSQFVGGLIGYIFPGNVTLTGCSFSGNVDGSSLSAGGLIGSARGTIIDNCYATGTVSGERSIGGLVGDYGGKINNSYADCTVTKKDTDYAAGGLVGYITSTSSISNCYAEGKVVSVGRSSGLVGYVDSPSSLNISDCYSLCDVEAGDLAAGGIVGFSKSGNVNISNSYFAGTISLDSGADPGSKIGGIVGFSGGTVNGCIYLSDSVDATNGEEIVRGTGVSSADMKKIETYESAGWFISEGKDASKAWIINEGGYPYLYAFDRIVQISSVDELKLIGSGEYNPLKGYNYTPDGDYVLTKNITITDNTWKTIGNQSEPFLGTFDGQGNSITFASSSGTTTLDNSEIVNSRGFGLFGTVGKTGWDKEIVIQNVKVVLKSNLTIDELSSGRDEIGALVGNVSLNSPDTFLMKNCSLTSQSNYNIDGDNGVGGLVGSVENGSLIDCSVSGKISILGSRELGGLAGYAKYDSIENCSVSGTVSVIGDDYVGGLVGSSMFNDFDKCSVSGNILLSAVDDYIGGLSGYDTGSVFESCFVSGNGSITAGGMSAGGLLGLTSSGTDITECFVSGNISVTSDTSAGGLIGQFDDSSVKDCYSTAIVKANDTVGGLVGDLSTLSTLESSYFAGKVSFDDGATASSLIGGISGSANVPAALDDCLYSYEFIEDVDTETPYSGLVLLGIETSSANMKKIGTYLNEGDSPLVSASWDITTDSKAGSTWFILAGQYPKLTATYVPPAKSSGGGGGTGGATIVDPSSPTPGADGAFGDGELGGDGALGDGALGGDGELGADGMPISGDSGSGSATGNASSGGKYVGDDQKLSRKILAGFSNEEGGINRTSYLLIGIGLIIVICCVAYYLYKKRE